MKRTYELSQANPPQKKEEEPPKSFWQRMSKTTRYIIIGSIVGILLLFLFLYFRKSTGQNNSYTSVITSDKNGHLPIETIDDIIIEQSVLDGQSTIGENKYIFY